MSAFPTKKPGGRIEADVFDGEMRLGHLTFDNVIFYTGTGCFSETYKVIQMLGLKDADFREKIDRLSIRNITMVSRVVDDKLDRLISERLAQDKSAEKKGAVADSFDAEKKRGAVPASSGPSRKENSSTEVRSGGASSGGALNTGSSSSSSDRTARRAETRESSEKHPGATAGAGSGPSDSEIRKRQVQIQKERMAREAMEQTQADLASDQAKVQGFSDAANSTFGAAIAAGFNVGLGFMTTDSEPMDAASNNNLFTFLIGKSKSPLEPSQSDKWFSGTAFTLAVNVDFLSPDPTPKNVSLGSSNSKRWLAMAEVKKFGNLKSMRDFQPYFGVGLARYKEYSPTLNLLDTRIAPTASFGLVFVKNDGWFSMGWNLSMGALDVGWGF